jgi:hypothetical protein
MRCDSYSNRCDIRRETLNDKSRKTIDLGMVEQCVTAYCYRLYIA